MSLYLQEDLNETGPQGGDDSIHVEPVAAADPAADKKAEKERKEAEKKAKKEEEKRKKDEEKQRKEDEKRQKEAEKQAKKQEEDALKAQNKQNTAPKQAPPPKQQQQQQGVRNSKMVLCRVLLLDGNDYEVEIDVSMTFWYLHGHTKFLKI